MTQKDQRPPSDRPDQRPSVPTDVPPLPPEQVENYWKVRAELAKKGETQPAPIPPTEAPSPKESP